MVLVKHLDQVTRVVLDSAIIDEKTCAKIRAICVNGFIPLFWRDALRGAL